MRAASLREFEKRVIDTGVPEIRVSCWYRVVPHRSYVGGWKISPSHFLGQDLATIRPDR